MDEVDNYNQILAKMEDEQNAALDILTQWSEINSGSYHLAGLAKMHDTLVQHFSLLDADIQSHQAEPYEVVDEKGNLNYQQTGKILTIQKRWHQSQQRVILCGHMDTVFTPDDPFQTVTNSAEILNGPGVADMKGGLLVIFYALKYFEQFEQSKDLGWKVIINADEEVGSLGSSKFLAEEAAQADVGLVYEPSMLPDGTFAGERKGSGKFSIVVTGKAAHAGRDFHQGKNAICHLAKLITAINEMNHPDATLTINVGLAHGGSALNVVADKAVVKLDVRYLDDQSKDKFISQLSALIKDYDQVEGFNVQLYGAFSRPRKPLTEKTRILFELLKQVGTDLNQPINYLPSGGCCDGNNLSALGLPVIDTLGVRGGKIHSSQEYMYKSSLIERSKLSALLLLRLAAGGIQQFKE